MGEESFVLDKHYQDLLFPFHFRMDQDLIVTSYGPGIKKIIPSIDGSAFKDHFEFIRPSLKIKYEYNSIIESCNQIIIIRSHYNRNLMLRGQFVELNNNLLFIGSPWMNEISDLNRLSLKISDFAIHDPVIDMLQVIKAKEIVTQDIQKQKDQLIAQHKEIEVLAKITDESPNPIIRISMEGVIQYANHKSQNLMQFWGCEVGGYYPESLTEQLAIAIKKEGPLDIELKTTDRHYSLQITPYLSDGYLNIYGKDITDKKIQEQRFKQLVEEARDIIYETDEDGYFIYTNPIAEKFFPFLKTRLREVHFTEIIRPDWRKKAAQFFEQQIDQQTSLTYLEFPVVTHFNEEVWIGQNTYLSEGSNSSKIRAVARDITEKMRMERSLQEAKEKAEESLRIKEDFLANMSHEIRTPMNGILGMSQLLASAPLSDKHRQQLHSIQTSANALLVIINDILDLSKIEAGKLTLEKVGFRLEDVVQNSIQSVEYLAADKDLFLQKVIDPELFSPILLGDPTRLGQLFTNFLSNAIKFTHQGQVSLSCQIRSQTHRAITILFSIIDTGIGIPQEKQEVIFNNFQQADTSTTRKFGGTGLGLAICQQLVGLHGGSIHVKSQPGKGSCFSFEIEYAIGKESDLPQLDSSDILNHDLKDVNVLLVEDHYINQVYATSLLENAQVHVTLAENGKEAIEILENKRFDLILMDIQMPEMGGIEATTIIRKKMKLSTPIIALTANALKGDAEKYMKAGMNAYISKPFNEIELLNKIALLLGNPIPTQEPEVPLTEEEIEEDAHSYYNIEKLNKMSRGKEEFVIRMINMFIEEVPKSLEVLNTALGNNDLEAVKNMAHKMKPSAGMMDMEEAKDILDQIEDNVLNDCNLEDIPQSVLHVNHVFDIVLNDLRSRYSSY